MSKLQLAICISRCFILQPSLSQNKNLMMNDHSLGGITHVSVVQRLRQLGKWSTSESEQNTTSLERKEEGWDTKQTCRLNPLSVWVFKSSKRQSQELDVLMFGCRTAEQHSQSFTRLDRKQTVRKTISGSLLWSAEETNSTAGFRCSLEKPACQASCRPAKLPKLEDFLWAPSNAVWTL